MQNFQRVFGTKQCSIIGMIHVKALPGTPNYDGNFNAIIEQAKHEASIYRKHQIVCKPNLCYHISHGNAD